MRNDLQDNTPNQSFTCPITQLIMTDPVIASDGNTYERASILEWLNRNPTSPVTRDPMQASTLVPNRALKDLIDQYNSNQNAITTREGSSSGDDRDNSIKALTQSELLEDLSKSFKESTQELLSKYIVQQALVALSGLYIEQSGTSFLKENGTINTNFYLKLPTNEDLTHFVTYYSSTYNNSLINNPSFNSNLIKITFNTAKLYEVIIPALTDLKENSHKNLIQYNASTLGVPYNDVFNGSIVEDKLVRKANIQTSQHNAEYRRNSDYSTRFMLNFANEEEHNRFIAYYSEHYPCSVLFHSDYQTGQKSQINFSTRLLTRCIIPDLKDVLITPNKSERCMMM